MALECELACVQECTYVYALDVGEVERNASRRLFSDVSWAGMPRVCELQHNARDRMAHGTRTLFLSKACKVMLNACNKRRSPAPQCWRLPYTSKGWRHSPDVFANNNCGMKGASGDGIRMGSWRKTSGRLDGQLVMYGGGGCSECPVVVVVVVVVSGGQRDCSRLQDMNGVAQRR
jgi:hypothetical protein